MKFQMYASLPASDIDRARAWYEKSLGVKPTMVDGDGSAYVYELGESGFVLYPSEFAGTNQATAAGIIVEDFDEASAALRAAGVTFEDYDFGDEFRTVDGILTDATGFRGAWFKDSEGNIIGMQEDRR